MVIKLPEYHERTAVLSWAVAGLSLVGAFAVTVLILRNGMPSDFSLLQTVLFVASWWFIAALVMAFSGRKACTAVVLLPDRTVKIVTQFLFKKHERIIPRSSIGAAEVIRLLDAEGDPYLTACFFVDAQERIVLLQGWDEASTQKAVNEFNAALNG